MKNSITLIFLLALNFAHGQWQKNFNLNFGAPLIRNERFNSGIKTRVNFNAGVPTDFHITGIGTSYNNVALPAPNNRADRMRFTMVSPTGMTRVNNGFQFATNDAHWLNASGNGIAEIDNGAGNGGYVAVGAVSNNPNTEGVVPGGSDVLFTQVSAAGAIVTAIHIDFNNRSDIGWCIRRSRVVTTIGEPTWILCGQSTNVNNNTTDCFVARVRSNGSLIWSKRYNFPTPNGNAAICIAKQLCEDANANIYVVGSWQAPGINNIDGLAFKITMAGAVIWKRTYNIGPDDEFKAVRIPNAGNGIVIGGLTRNGVISNMLFMQIDAAGVLGFRNILQAQDAAGVFYPSQCHDLVQTPAGDYVLAGFLIKNGATVQVMYKASVGGAGILWNSYNQMLYTEGFGVDYINDVAPGIAFLSSKRNAAFPTFSDSHIMKTDLFAKTCFFCGGNPPLTAQANVQQTNPNCIEADGAIRDALNSLMFNYDQNTICTGGCAAAAIAPSENKSQSITPQKTNSTMKVSPNPASGSVHMQFRSLPAGEYQVKILSMKGEVVLQNKRVLTNGSAVTDIDMSSLASGVYMITVSKDNLVLQQKIVKQ